MLVLAAKLPGRIFSVEIAPGSEYIVHRHGWLCGTPDISPTVALQQTFGGAIFGGEGFILQRLEGEGTAWIELSGEVSTYELAAGQSLCVHPGHVGAFHATVSFQTTRLPGIANYMFGEDGHHVVVLTGPGTVWLQSMPIPLLAHALRPYLGDDKQRAAWPPAWPAVCSEACSAASSDQEPMTPTDSQLIDLVAQPVLERVLHEALRRGGDFAEVFVEDRSSSSIFLDDRKVEELSSGRDRGAGIRVIVGETTGFAHTADLSETGLLAAAEAAAAVAREGDRRRARDRALANLAETPARGDASRHRPEVDQGRAVAASRRGRPFRRRCHRPGERRIRRQPATHPRGEFRRTAGRRRPRPVRGSS